ncbi:hypothetical protein [uncultured Pelagimonas sp.]|uniref:hypothetical protein n=1 Tax=uncultured Pelagimonas sp. TaxID=1618102 RepID=UPI00261EB831|nr:hypothetical protein [uncultured Pelagimonas sp.]
MADGHLIAIHSRTDATDKSPSGGDREDWNIEVFLVPDGLEIPEQVDDYTDILALFQDNSLGLADIHLGEFNALNPTSLGMDYDSSFSPELVTDRGIFHVVVTTQIS